MAEGPPAPTGLFIAVADFYSDHEGPGRPVPVERGTIAHGKHTIVRYCPGMWQPLHVDYNVTTTDEDEE